MSDLELVNLFNSLCVSSSRVVFQNGHYRVYLANAFLIFLLSMAISVITGSAGFAITRHDLSIFLERVIELIGLIRYGSLVIISYIVNVVFLLQSQQFDILLKHIVLYDHHYDRISNKWQTQIKVPLVRAQLIFICIIHTLILGFRCAANIEFSPRIYVSVMLIGSSFVEFHLFLQQLFVQFFVEHVTVRFRLLRHRVAESTLHRERLVQILRLFDEIVSIRQLMASFFGMLCLLTTLMVFVCSSIIMYGSLHLLESGFSIAILCQDGMFLLPWVTSFYGFTYQFERMNTEEQEFKNAIKSLQYDATEQQSEEYLNFLDLINLKLMTETPKITACGLFTVNLQVFYNVFAAIVTYIMILFQFRDFEK